MTTQKKSERTSSGTDEKSVAGQKGVPQDQVGAGKDKDPNNFANDKDRASAAGKKGGQSR